MHDLMGHVRRAGIRLMPLLAGCALLAGLLPACLVRADDVGLTCAASGHVERTRFTVEVEGNGPDVVLIPGLSTPGAVWDATVRQLVPDHRVHRIELRGFVDGNPGPNASGPVLEPFVDELAVYLKECGLEQPALIGHSMGGLAALMVGVRAPELPGRIMVVDAAPFIGPLFNPPAATVEQIEPMAAQLRAGLEAMAKLPLPQAMQGPVDDPGEKSQAGTLSNTPEGRTLIAGWMRHVDRRVVGRVLYDVMRTDLRPELARIRVPVTLLYAQDDRQRSIEKARADFEPQYAGVSRFHAVQVPDSYHFLMLDQPAAFAREVAAFLRSSGTEPPTRPKE